MMPFLVTCPAGILKPRLRLMLSGPELPSEENQASNQARNIQFKLWLAATFFRAGAAVTLAEPDLRVAIGAVTVLVACKRLTSVWKLTKRINEATKQVHQWLQDLPVSAFAGAIAISLSPVLPTNEPSETISSRGEGLQLLSSRIELLVERRAKWRRSCEVFHTASTFTNRETGRIESGCFVTMYGSSSVAEAFNERLQPLAG